MSVPAWISRPSRLATCGVLLFTVACGGESPGGTDTGTPASIGVAGGDNQSAAPGAAVAVAPTVVVRDAQGRPVSGITVTFTVDSGGGSVTSPTAATNASGIVSPGTWTLGAAGPQVLGATAGTLPKVKIRASAQVAATPIVTQTVGTGGGTIPVSRPGSPFDGATLTFSPGSLPSAMPVTLASVPTAGIALPAGVTTSGDALAIASNGGRLRQPAFLRVPIGAIPVADMVILLRDRSTGAIQMLPRVGKDATSITVMLPTVDPTPPAAVKGFFASLLAGAADEEFDIEMLMAALPASVKTDPFDSRFRPGSDDWDFPGMAVAALPFLRVGDEEFIVPLEGMVATELWYYATHRKGGGAPLWGSTQLQPGEPLSSRDGIRWVSYAYRDAPNYLAVGSALVSSWRAFLEADEAGFIRQQFEAIRGLHFITRNPVPIALSTDQEFSLDLMGIAFQAEGNDILFSVPAAPGQTFRATLTPQGMTPVTIPTPKGETTTIVRISAMTYGAVVDEAKLAPQYAQVLSHTIGNGQWPEARLMMKDGALDTGKVFLDASLQHWWECPQCPDFGFKPSQLPASASHVLSVRFGSTTGGTWGGLGSRVSSMNFSEASVPENNPVRPVKFLVALPQSAAEEPAAFAVTWLDWVSATYRRLKLTPAPDKVEVGGTQTVAFAVTPDVAPPTGTRYSWVLITSSGRDSVETAGPNYSRQIAAGTEGSMLIQAHEPGTKRIISHVSVPITAGASPFWVLTSIQDQDDLLDPDNEAGGTVVEALRKLMTTPAAGLIGVAQNGNVSEFWLHVRASGTWAGAPCCPPVVPPGEKVLLGVTPAVQFPFGPYFNLWRTGSWSQTTTDLATGSMTGQYAPGIINYPVKNGGTQAGPDYAVRITATRNGTTLTGTITFINFFVGILDGALTEDDADEYRFPFTATRLK